MLESHEWRIEVEGSSVFVNASFLTEERTCVSQKNVWFVDISTNSGCPLKTAWTKFAIPYHTLTLMQPCLVHDCQLHAMNLMHTFNEPQKYLETMTEHLPRLFRKRALQKMHLVDENGQPRF